MTAVATILPVVLIILAMQHSAGKRVGASSTDFAQANPSKPSNGRTKRLISRARSQKTKDLLIERRLNVTTRILKATVERLAEHSSLDLLFTLDESLSMGQKNFMEEIKFVSRVVSAMEVDMNHTRVAVVTFSDKITTWVNQVSTNDVRAHKCSLLQQDLPNITYTGGGTFTRGALLKIEEILQTARPHSKKAVFLVTDGYSNGGNPIPAAAALKRRAVEIFTFGVSNGNLNELTEIASAPKNEHRIMLNSFAQFEIITRRALHSAQRPGQSSAHLAQAKPVNPRQGRRRQMSRVNVKKPKDIRTEKRLNWVTRIFKAAVDKLAEHSALDLLFVIDESSSVELHNFLDEIKFVSRLVSGIEVDMNHTRVAVVTFSDNVTTWVNQVSMNEIHAHKCSLLGQDLPNIDYTGGGTFTKGALTEIEHILQNARDHSKKTVFLITDGYSNGGNPIPVAAALKRHNVELFTFGILDGNKAELTEIASNPKNEHRFILNSFAEFEIVARRALHSDLETGRYIVEDSSHCGKFCTESNCCHGTADCRCGTTTGKYECVCRPGYYGTGLEYDQAGCAPCPEDTYKDEALPGDVKSCTPCPDSKMNSPIASTSLDQCMCARGFKKVNASCQVLMCDDIPAPENGYFLDCDNEYKSLCTAACNTGYDLQGTATVVCAINEKWTSTNGTEPVPAFCQVRYCDALQAPENGEMECTKKDHSYGTSCQFVCHEGYKLHGSQFRTCESQRKWTGADAECSEITCPPLPTLKHGTFSGDCPTIDKGKYGDTCSFACPQDGYELVAAPTVTCEEDGHWFPTIDKESVNICNDTVPPTLSCPGDMTLSTSPRSPFAKVVWEVPDATDNSGAITLSPSYEFPVSMRIGSHIVTYTATDDSDLSSHCDFTVIVVDDEPPMVDRCIGPPAFIIDRGETKSGYIDWIEPKFSDNSGSLTVESNSTFGIFPLGKSVIAYTATDDVGLERTCFINIHVQDSSCPALEKPRRGYVDCIFSYDDTFACDLNCYSERDGFAMNKDGNLHFRCLVPENQWDPKYDYPLDCSKQKYSSQVLKDFEVTYSIGTFTCNDPSLLEGIRQYLFDVLSVEVPKICEGQVDGLLRCVLVDVTVECITVEVETPTDTSDTGGNIYDEYDSYTYDERERRRRRRSVRGIKRTAGKRQNRVKRGEPVPPPLDDYYSNTNGPYDYGNGNYGYPDGASNTDVGFEGAETIPDDVNGKLNAAVTKIVGDIVPDSISRSDTDPMTQSKIQVRLTIRGEVPLEGSNGAGDRTRHTRMVEFIRNMRLTNTFSHPVLQLVAAEDINATSTLDLTFDEDSYSDSDTELTCPVGTVLKDRAFCVNCPVGSLFNILSGDCESCPVGYFQDLEAQLSCQPCPTGTSTERKHARSVQECRDFCAVGYSSRTGLEDCTACPPGFFADATGATKCTKCPPGNGTIGSGADSLDDCGELCKTGFVSLTGFAPCQPCPLGTFHFRNETGMTFCHVCATNDGRESNDFVNCPESDLVSWTVEAIPGLKERLGKLYYNECFAKPCKNNATCTGHQSTFTCECQPGYTGTLCETEINECIPNPCADTSVCVDLLDAFRCDCDPGYTGLLCNEEINECASNPCQNGATCVDLIDAFSCDCVNGYTGLLCEINVDECASDPCENNGECVDEVDGFHCVCEDGYTGAVCQTNIDDCAQVPCLNGGTCNDGLNSFTCECAPGYIGSTCDENINECESSPCVNGECMDLVNSYKCLCPPTYLGEHCEKVGDPYYDLEFNKPNTYHHSRIDYALPNMTEVTISFYLQSNYTQDYMTPFSYAVGDGLEADALALTDLAALTLYVNGYHAVSDLKRLNDGKWYLVTVTWKSEGGAWNMYLNDQLEDSGDNLATGETIPGGGVLVIGQEQDTLGGGFSASQEFLGTISQVNVYDFAMTFYEVKSLWRNCANNVGNVRAWPEFAGGIVGRLEKKSTRFCLPCPEVESDDGTVINKVNKYTINVTCNVGHELIFPTRAESPYIFRCGNDATWKFFGRDAAPEKIKCDKITCNDIGQIALGNVSSTGNRYGDVAEYTCVEGYHPVGDAIRTCQPDKSWSGNPPVCEDVDECKSEGSCHSKANCTNSIGSFSCECIHGWKGNGHTCREIYCGGAGSLIFGSIEGDHFKLGGIVRFSCDYGYRLEGPNERVCLFNDSWSEYMPECVKVECQEPEHVRHGYKKPRSAIWDYKSQITYFCQPGYYLVGNPKRECGPDSQWTGTLPSCERVSCGSPRQPANGLVILNGGGVKFEDTVNYVCYEHYRLLGPAMLTCNASKSWEGKNGDLPVCEHPTCDEPLSIIHGTFSIKETGESTVTDATYTYDTVVGYICDIGYNLVGATDITCKERGSWDKSAPICQIVSCGPPPTVENSVQHHNGQLYGDLANYFCKSGYFLEGSAALTCLASGKWTDDKQLHPSCNPKPCPTPRQVPHSTQTLSEADEYVYKAVVRYECDLGYWESGTNIINCDTEGQWQPAQNYQCDIAVCPAPSAPQYGNVVRQQPHDGNAYEYNNTILYSCDDGFYSVGKLVARCTEFGNWSNDAPTCLPIVCPLPASVGNSDVSIVDGPYGTGALFKSQLSYTCDSGYEQTDGDALRDCASDKSWTGTPPQCSRVSCGDAPIISHANSYLQPFESDVSGSDLLYRDRVSYFCDTGFYMIGGSSVECTASREFSEKPTCNPMPCGNPPDVVYSTHESKHVFGENVYQSTLTYTCEKDFRMSGNPVRVCDEYGQWTMDDPPICEAITCGEPDLVENSIQFVSSSATDVAHPDLYKSGKHQPRAAAITACKNGYQILTTPQVKSAAPLTDGLNTAIASDEEMARGINSNIIDDMDDTKQDRVRKILTKYLGRTPDAAALVLKSASTGLSSPDTLHLRQCSESVGWLKAAPKCVPILCPTPFKIESGHLVDANQSDYQPPFQDGVDYSCDEGFRFADANSTNEIRRSSCEWSDDLWNVYLTPVPLCVPLPCSLPPQVDHGSYSQPAGDSFVFQDVVSYTCDIGYEMTAGPSSMTCQSTQSWSDNPPTCSPVKCPRPAAPENGGFKGNALIYESTVSFRCNKGYNLIGTANLTCLANRTWSSAYPSCEPVPCGSPPKVEHAEVSITSKVFQGCASYLCENGFHLKGFSELKCTATGEWKKQPPTCEFTKCPTPPFGEHVTYTDTDVHSPFIENGSYVYYDVITYGCEEGYETNDANVLSAECLVEDNVPKSPTCENIELITNEPVGNWSRSPPVCTAKDCGTPPAPHENATSIFDDTTFNSTVNYKCKKGYYTDDDTPFAICRSDATWSRMSSPVCHPVPCGEPIRPKNGYFNGIVFTYKGKIQYGCNDGYNLLGASTITCLAKGNWSDVAPVCEPKDCGDLSLIQHGTLQFEDTIFGEEAIYLCSEGYYLKGKTLYECQATGRWSHPTPPKCFPKACGVLKPPANGIVNATGHVFLDTASYSCNSGYYMVGSNQTECLSTTLWSEPTPECRPVDCGTPADLANGHIIVSGPTTFKSSQKYGCDPGYEMTGAATITCQADKSWTASPLCQRVKCPAPKLPLNGLISEGSRLDYRYEDTVAYSCKQGYRTDDVTETECTASRTWSNPPPTCSPVDCGQLPAVYQGIKSGEATTFMTVITFGCRIGYYVVGNSSLECLHTASWSSNVPACEKISCGKPFHLKNGFSNDGNDPKNWLYDSYVTYSCDEGYHLHGSSEVQCDVEGWFYNYNEEDEDSHTYEERTAEPVCELITCQHPADLTNGSFPTKEYTYGEIVKYTCDEGYDIVKDGEVTCSGRSTTVQGFYAGNLPVCNPVSCGRPEAITHGKVKFGDVTFNHKATYSCDAGYNMIGDADVVCKSNRLWSTRPKCIPKDCDIPDLPEYSNLNISSTLFPTVLNVECEVGYYLEGADSLRCTENGTWSNIGSFKCLPVPCGNPRDIKNGSVTNNGVVFKKTAMYQCDSGFNMMVQDVEIESNTIIIKCQSNGEWENGIPHCVPKECGMPPETANGTSVTSAIVVYPEKVSYQCDYGYELEPTADPSIQCTESGKFSSAPPTCRRVSCGAPKSIPNAIVDSEANTYQGTAEYMCDLGYVLTTETYPSEYFTSVCTGEKAWAPLPPDEGCVLYDCGPPLILNNAEVPQYTRKTKYGDMFTYECVKGHEAPENDLTIVCERYGMWSEGPSCQPVNCGRYECAKYAKCKFNDTIYESIVESRCITGYEHQPDITSYSVQCTDDATWAVPENIDNPSLCKRLSCGRPPSVENAKSHSLNTTAGSNKLSNLFESMYQYQCDAGYDMVGGEDTVSCLADGTWGPGPLPICEAKDCAAPPTCIKHANCSYTATTFQSDYTVSCNEGYEIEYDLSQTKVTCNEFGVWAVPPSEDFQCLPRECKKLPYIQNGHAVLDKENGSNPTYREKVGYECDPGYDLQGEAQVTCQSDRNYTQPPTCTPVSCGAPFDVQHGQDNATGEIFESEVVYSCDKGYFLHGERNWVCGTGAKWIPAPPQPPLLRRNVLLRNMSTYEMQVMFSEGSGRSEEGSERSVEGSGMQESLDGPGKRNIPVHIASPMSAERIPDISDPPECRPVPCSVPPRVANSIEQLSDVLVYGQSVTYTCKPGFEMIGEANLLCQASGKLGPSPPPICVRVKCPMPEPLPHCEVLGAEPFKFEDVVTYRPSVGYEFSPAGPAKILISCTEDRTSNFTDLPSCVPVSCGKPRDVVNGNFYSDAFTYQENASYNCDVGYEMIGNPVLTCLSTREWSSAPPKCPPVSCGALTAMAHTKMEISRGDVDPFTYKQSANFTCDEGYMFEDVSVGDLVTVTCLHDKQWDGTPPRCVPVPCSELSPVDNGVFNLSGTPVFKSTATYHCDVGHEMLGEPVLICEASGSWSSDPPKCNPVSCEIAPVVPYSNHQSPQELVFNEQVVYECIPGYKLQGSSTIRCLDDQTFDNPTPVCTPVECETPQPLLFGIYEEDAAGFLFMSSIVYKCNEGYEMDSENGVQNKTVSCQADKTWSGEPPICSIKSCGVPKSIAHGTVNYNDITYKSNATYRCLPGYEMEKTSTGIKECAGEELCITCQSNAVWGSDNSDRPLEPPTCYPVSCGNPPEMDNADWESTSLVFQGNTTYACHDGYEFPHQTIMTITCQENALWSELPHVCERVKCQTVPNVEHGGLEIVHKLETGLDSFLYEDIIRYECEHGYQPSVLVNLTCGSDKHWDSKPPICEPVDCGTPPAREHGYAVSHVKKSLETTFQSIVTYDCDNGFEFNGNVTEDVFCTADGIWSAAPPPCTRVNCGYPENISHGRFELLSNKTTFRSKVQYFCDVGHEMVGEGLLKCKADKTWKPSAPQCLPVSCSTPPKIDHGYPIVKRQLSRPKTTEKDPAHHPKKRDTSTLAKFVYEDVVMYECDVGYTFQSESRNARCNEEANWVDVPVCSIVECEPLPPRNNSRKLEDSHIYDSVVTYECDIGFVLADGATSVDCKCRQDGHFSPVLETYDGDICKTLLPKCTRRSCGAAPHLRKGFIQDQKNEYLYQDEAHYECNDGYKIHGEAILQCQSNGIYNHPPPRCRRINCGTPPTVKDAIPVVQNGTKFTDVISYECRPGYTLVSDSYERVCKSDGAWSDDYIRCDPINCTDVTLPDHLNVDSSLDTKFGSTVSFGCHKGYNLIGRQSISCEASGDWSSFVPECMPIVCSAIPDVLFGIPFSNIMIHHFKDVVKYICLEGYLMEGSPSIECLSSGEWTATPTCYPVACPDVPAVANAVISNPEAKYTFMDRVLYECEYGFSLTSTDSSKSCQSDETFSDEIITCSRIPCPPSPQISHGKPSALHGVYGDKITYTCDEGYEMLASDSLVCSVNEQLANWKGVLPECVPVSCGSAPQIINGNKTSDPDEYHYQETVSYECSVGHEFDGPSKATCLAGRNFSVTSITCQPVTCQELVLTPNPESPLLKSATFEIEPFSGAEPTPKSLLLLSHEDHLHSIIEYKSEEKEYLTEAHVTCEPGYVLKSGKSQEQFVCQATKLWDGNYEGSQCVPVQCLELPDLADGDVEMHPSPELEFHDGHTTYDGSPIYGTTANFICDDGYNLEGVESVTCNEYGRWSSPPPKCSPVLCGIPPYVHNSVYIESNFTYGMVAEYECAEKYILGENKHITCQADGTFSNETIECLPILCPKIPETDHGVLRREVSRVGDKNDYLCDEGYESNTTVECLLSGEWNGGLDPCTPVQCNHPPVLENSILTNADRSFEYGDEAEYACVQGHYLPDGSQTFNLSCQPSKLFSQPSIKCSPIECDLKLPVAHGYLNHASGVAVYGDSVDLICNDGYKSSIGEESIYCTDNGEWDLFDATCDIVQCGTAPSIWNAKPELDQNHVYVFNNTIKYHCDEGYYLVDDSHLGYGVVSCLSNGTFQGSENVVCAPVVCQIPGDFESGSLSKEEATFGQSLIIECDEGFLIEGHEHSEATLVCQSDGQWSEDISSISCSAIICDELEALIFGSISLQDGEDEIIINTETDDLVSGSVIRYKCDTGYTLQGVSKQSCSNEGKWSGTLPFCSPVLCGKPPFILHGSILGGDDYTYGNVISYECDEGYRLYPEVSSIRTCNEMGSWSRTHPLCQIKTCDVPAPVLNGDIHGVDYNYGSEIEITCDEGYLMTKGSPNRTCLSNESWSEEEPICERSCGEYPPVQHGVVEPAGVMYAGEKITITCEEGVADLFGEAVHYCREDGLWDGIESVCVPFLVKEIQFDPAILPCKPPNVKSNNVKILKDEKIKDNYSQGDVLHYECEPGFMSAGNMTIQCHHGEWSDLPQCRPSPKCRYKCQHNGRCNGRKRCTCSHGWKGSRCHKPSCSMPCLNGAYCSGPNLCTCKSGWTGTRCQQPVCSKPCQNGGRCTAPDECYCPFGYGGVDCSESSYFSIW